jgi:hypothetical protein
LVASDGTTGNEITLIDSNGCPTEPAILGAIKRRQVRKEGDASRDEDEEGEGWRTESSVFSPTDLPEVLEADAQRPARLQIDQQSATTTLAATTTTQGSSTTTSAATSPDTAEPVSTTVSSLTSSSETSTLTTSSKEVSSSIGTTTAIERTDSETRRAAETERVTAATQSLSSTTTTTLPPTPTTLVFTTIGSLATVTSSVGKPSPKSGSRLPSDSGSSEGPAVHSKQLEATFEAFKFPTTNLVQFRAVITPCLGECAPVRCTLPSSDGSRKTAQSFGRRRRRSVSGRKADNVITEQPMIVIQSIQITDKNESDEGDRTRPIIASASNRSLLTRWTNCLTAGGLGLIVGLLLFGQIAVIAMWLHFRSHWRQWRHQSWTPRPAKDAITSVSVAGRY